MTEVLDIIPNIICGISSSGFQLVGVMRHHCTNYCLRIALLRRASLWPKICQKGRDQRSSLSLTKARQKNSANEQNSNGPGGRLHYFERARFIVVSSLFAPTPQKSATCRG